jgi:hypothetical protein
VEQELFTLPEHPSPPPIFSGVRVTRFLVLDVYFVDRCFCTFVLRRRTDNTMARRRRTDNKMTRRKSTKVQKQRSTKYTSKTKNRVTRTPLKIGGGLGCSGRVNSSCSTSDTRRVNLVTNPVISHERGKDREVFTTSGTYPWPFPKNSVWKVMKPLCRTNSFAQFFVLLFSFQTLLKLLIKYLHIYVQ